MENNVQLTFDDFMSKYHPVKNPLNSGRGMDDCQFETYDEDLQYVRTFPDQSKVWTLIDNNDGWFGISAGFHTINRMGFLITEESWGDSTEEYAICDEGPVNEWFFGLSIDDQKSLFPDLEMDPEHEEEYQLTDAWYELGLDEREELQSNFKQ